MNAYINKCTTLLRKNIVNRNPVIIKIGKSFYPKSNIIVYF